MIAMKFTENRDERLLETREGQTLSQPGLPEADAKSGGYRVKLPDRRWRSRCGKGISMLFSRNLLSTA